MNLIIVEESDYINKEIVRLKGRRLKHILSVHKANKGEMLRVGVLNGKVGKGEVLEINKEFIDLKVNLMEEPPKASNIKIILAMPRPKVFKRILMDLTTMGVKEIYIIKTWRVEKSFFSSPALEEESLRETMILGLEQAKDTILPKVTIKKLFRPFIEDEISEIIKDTRAIVAHPTGNEECPRNLSEEVTLLIGPEGGLIPFEVDLLESFNFEVVTLGNRILRVETVVPYIMGRFS